MNMIYVNNNIASNSKILIFKAYLIWSLYFYLLKLAYEYRVRVNFMHDHSKFFLEPKDPVHKLYEALRIFYIDRLSSKEIARKFGWSEKYFNKLRSYFHQALLEDNPPQFFVERSPGPKEVEIELSLKEKIIGLRKESHSIQDIKAILNAKDIQISLRQINKVLKVSGFTRLPKRTRVERHQARVSMIIEPPKAESLDLPLEPPREFTTRYGGVFFFVPIIKELNLHEVIHKANYPQTSQLTSLNYILSLIFLKLIDKERLSHIDDLSLDAGAGLFAALNVLPKSSSISSYSYKTERRMNLSLLKGLYRSVRSSFPYGGDIINLDFTAIPHWGDLSVLERNWSGTRRRALKSVLALVASDQDTGFIPYGTAEIKHRDRDKEVLRFIDFWKESSPDPIKCLIFDSKFTTYENLNLLNRDRIKFITLRRRGKNLVQKANQIPNSKWNTIQLDNISRKYRKLRVHESKITLQGYEGKLRQLIVTNHGRKEPAFIITNDFKSTSKEIVTKYARRWLVEKSISEQIHFFHLNLLSSSIVIKVDLDLTMTITAHTLYRLLAKRLTGFENAESKFIFRNFIDNIADIEINYPNINIKLLKKVHYPILFEEGFFKEVHIIPWLDSARLSFSMQNTT
jgi:hypothetical protein